MKRITKRIVTVIIVSILLISILTPYVQAGFISDAKAFIERGNEGDSKIAQDTINDKVGSFAGFLYAIGVLVAIIATVVLGINYMTASSSDNKAEIKKKAIAVAVGTFVLFASGTIWQVVVSTLSKTT